MVFQIQLGLSNAAENFMSAFLRSQQIAQQEQLQDIRERELELREAERQERNLAAIQNLGGQQGGLVSPQAQQFVQQVANATSPAGTINAAAPAAAAEQRARAAQTLQQTTSPTQVPSTTPGVPAGGVEVRPDIGEFEQAAQTLGVPTQTRGAIRQEAFPTEQESLQQQLSAWQQAQGLQVARAIEEGRLNAEDVATTNDLGTLAGVAQLGLDEDIRAIRSDLRERLSTGRDLAVTLRENAQRSARSALDEANLEGEVPLGLATKFVLEGPGGLSEEQMTTIAPLRRSLRTARQKQQIGLITELEDTPVQATLSAFASAALRDGDQEGAIEFINRKREFAQQQTGLSGAQLPYPQIEEESGGFLGIGGPSLAERFTLPAGSVEIEGLGQVSQQELTEAAGFVRERHGGDADAAFREMRRRAREAGGVEELPEEAQRAFQIVRFLRDSLKNRGSQE